MREERLKQVESLIKLKVDIIIRNELSDPRLDLMSIVSINVSKELDYADIYVSHPGGDETRNSIIAILDKASGFIQKNLARATRLRKVPKLRFKLDESLIHAARIDEILKNIKKDEPDDSEDDNESTQSSRQRGSE